MTPADHVASTETAPITVLPALAPPDSASEINHRVANSLQLLAAMVSIEARQVADPAALVAFDMTLRRISAIARVHRQLYRTASADAVDLGAYVAELSADLEQGLSDSRAGRRIDVTADTVMVTPEAAASIGIILSELIGNACKYAYAPGEPGEVQVLLRAEPFGGYRLEIADRGRGIDRRAAAQGTGFGTRLVAMMAQRLGARHGWRDAAPGTRFVLHVPRP